MLFNHTFEYTTSCILAHELYVLLEDSSREHTAELKTVCMKEMINMAKFEVFSVC